MSRPHRISISMGPTHTNAMCKFVFNLYWVTYKFANTVYKFLELLYFLKNWSKFWICSSFLPCL